MTIHVQIGFNQISSFYTPWYNC